jgi:hypothetical protein
MGRVRQVWSKTLSIEADLTNLNLGLMITSESHDAHGFETGGRWRLAKKTTGSGETLKWKPYLPP